ncbi:MAG: TRAP transporter large permease subunit [Deltaproteobacteria bacterium]|nr:TRAP transporter large permease subunit [Deltaproteobacteria bacterium]
MAGAAPTAKPAPFLRPLDRLDRGVLLAESALSLVIVVFMLFAAVSESAFRVIQNWHLVARIGLCAALWLMLVGLKLSGAPTEPAPAEGLVKRLLGKDLPRRAAVNQAIAMFAPAAIVLGAATEWLMRAVLPIASDVLLHGTIWAAFLGASFATRGRKHLAIDALSRLLPDRGRRIVVGVSATMGAFVAFALAQGVYGSLMEASHQVIRTLEENRRNGVSSPIDQSFEYQYVIPAGFLFIGLRLALHGFHEFVAGLANYKAPERRATPMGDPVAAAHEGASVEEAKLPPAVDRADATEIGIALAALVGLIAVVAGSTIVKPVLGMCLLAAVTLVVPLINRKRTTGSYEPPYSDPYEPVQGAPQHFAIAAVLVLSILAVMRYGLVPHIATIPITAGIAFFAVMALLGAPLFSFLGGMGLFLFVKFFLVDPDVSRHANAFGNSVEDILGNHFARMSVLATIPLFTLAGYIMSESRMPQRLVRVSRALLGWMPGGLAVVCVFASAFFTIFSGASGITIVAVGGLLVPALLRDKYPEKFSLGLVTAGGALGITVPPCLPLIVYGIVAGLQEPAPGQERLELQKFLVVGLVPGLVAIGIVIVYCVIVGVISKVPRSRFDWAEAKAALWEAKWELILPVFLLTGLVKGIFNPSQAAAFTAFYVVVMEVFVYRDLTIKDDLPRIIPESMVLVGAIFVKLCAATVLVGYFVQAQIADRLFEWLTCGPPALAYMHAHADSIGTCREAVDILGQNHQSAGGLIDSKLSFLIALNFFLLLIGMLMDIFSAIVVVVPLIAGIALHFNINPYHLGIVFLMNLEIGYLMPPMGLNLFIAGFRFNRPVPDLYKMVLPFIALFIGALMIVTYVPALTTFTIPRSTVATAPIAAPNAGTTPGAAAPAPGEPALPPAGNCDTPGEDESFDDFTRRCTPAEDTDGGEPAAAPDPAAPAAESRG